MASENDTDGRVDQVERGQEILRREVEALRRELAAHGIRIPQAKPGAPAQLTPEARKALFQRAAAKARAAKGVGKGRGTVNDPETASRLRQEAAELLAGVDDTDEPGAAQGGS